MAARANSTLSKPTVPFDLVSECSRFSPISRLTEDDERQDCTTATGKYSTLENTVRRAIHFRESDRRSAAADGIISGRPNSMCAQKETALLDDFCEVDDAGQPHYEIPIWICGEPRFISGISCATTCRDIIQALIDDELHGNFDDEDDNDVNDDDANYDQEEEVGDGKGNWPRVMGKKLHPVYNDGQLVSHNKYGNGDDNDGEEIAASSAGYGRLPPPRRRYRQSGECNVNIDRRKDFTAASRDLSDYVITERWRDVEQPLNASTKILSIWQAWGSARNEVRFKLKINKSKDGQNDTEFAAPTKAAATKNDKRTSNKKQTFKALSKMMHRLVKQSEYIQQHLARISDKPKSFDRATSAIDLKLLPHNNASGKTLLMRQFLQNTNASTVASIEPRASEPIYVRQLRPGQPMPPINVDLTDDDELFLLIDNRHDSVAKRNPYPSDDQDSGVHVEYRQYVLNKKINDQMSARLMQLSETPKRKLRTKNDLDRLRARSLITACVAAPATPTDQHVLRDRHDMIRQEVAHRLLEMNRLLQYETALEQSLRNRSKQYQSQNQRYTAQNGLTASIDRIQAKLDAYTKEIVSNEIELFQIRLDISQKCGILHNLRRMLAHGEAETRNQKDNGRNRAQQNVDDRIHEELFKQQITTRQPGGIDRVVKDENEQYVDMTFVDNIYEFCDNNKSIVV